MSLIGDSNKCKEVLMEDRTKSKVVLIGDRTTKLQGVLNGARANCKQGLLL